MAHTGTLDLGRQAKPSSSRNPWQAALAIVAIAAVAVVYLATAFSLTSGNLAAKPVGDRSDEQIEAQRSAVTRAAALPTKQDLIFPLPNRVVVPSTPADSWNQGQYDSVRLPLVVAPREMTSGTFHAGNPGSVPAEPQMTSGTFHAGNPVAQEPIKPLGNLKTIDNPAKRDRVGGQ